jgi:SAM-dependent methyltransferase
MIDRGDDPGAFWDQKYQGEGYFYGTEPNAWLTRQAHLLQPGMRALAVADGEGRNGVWLAGRGLQVTSVDASGRALAKARALAATHGVALTTIQADLRRWTWPDATFDAVIALFAHFRPDDRRQLHRAMLRALGSGGVLLLEAFSPYQLLYRTGGPPDLAMLYSAHRLREDFAEAEIVSLGEVVTGLAEGDGHLGPSALVRLIARRR